VEHVIRPATSADVPTILELIHGLAVYEREPDAVEATGPMISAALFGTAPVASCHLAELDGQVVGVAPWDVTIYTMKGNPEDLFVRPEARGHGLGKALLQRLASVCVERGYARFEWWVLDWNVDAQGFYRSIGARPEDDWTVWRLDGTALAKLGDEP
jgi:GNAT superfamily N-acetyltransferase